MTSPLDFIESDTWPLIRQKIEAERARRIEGLLHVGPDGLRGEQKFIAALDWVVDQAYPKAPDNEEPIYDD